MGLEIFPFQDVAQLFPPVVRIGKRENEPQQGIEMIDEVIARNLSPGAEIPDAGFADDLLAARTRAKSLTFAIGPCRLFIEDARDLHRIESVAGEAQRGKHS